MVGATKQGFDSYANWRFKRDAKKPRNPYVPFSVKQVQWQKGWKYACDCYASFC